MTEYEYQELDGVALASLLQKGEVNPVDLMQHAVALASTRGKELNAIAGEQYVQSLEVARHWLQRGPFRGVPLLLKDSGLACERIALNLGSRLFSGTQTAFNATLTDRFEHAGLIPFARTTVPELCMAPTTEAVLYGGPTLNPWDASRSVGGSSGGAAAAVAARIVPVAHGSDGGGSIRIPASCCGVYGFKATRGRVPTGPSKGEIWGGLATDGVLSRTVRDTAVAMDAICGRELGSPYDTAAPVLSYQAAIKESSHNPLRVAVWRQTWDGIPIAPECLDAVEYAASLCAALGHTVIEVSPPPLDYSRFFRSHVNVLASNIVASVNAKLAASGRELAQGDLEPAIHDGYELGQRLSAESYIESINCFHQVARVFQQDMSNYDLILSPTLTQLPVPLDYLNMRGGFVQFRERVSKYATFLVIMNASGQPAASVPVYWTKEGIPVGVQLMAQFGRDDLVLRMSAEFERVASWHARVPLRFL